MGLLRILKSDRENIRRSHVKNLICVALADGHLDPDEWDLLVTISKVMGFTEEEIHAIKSHPDRIQFRAPKKYSDKIQQIHDLVAVMTVDNHISPREVELCKRISLRLNILPNIIDDIISDIVNPRTTTDSSRISARLA